jgi:hypothetical protein
MSAVPKSVHQFLGFTHMLGPPMVGIEKYRAYKTSDGKKATRRDREKGEKGRSFCRSDINTIAEEACAVTLSG